jgi:preprotein translocase subunit SecF
MLNYGGATAQFFAAARTFGILYGIYSSVLVMAPIVMWLGVSREDLVKSDRKREGGNAEKILP